jgi:hypothetical protein
MSRLPDALLDGPRGGETYSPARDGARLNKQARAVFDLMADGKWRTLREISDAVKASEASVSARLRDFRKPEFGGHVVAKRRFTDAVWQYRLEVVS